MFNFSECGEGYNARRWCARNAGSIISSEMSHTDIAQIERLQERINSALRETPEDRLASKFSDYMPDHSPALVQELERAAEPGGPEGIEAALEEFERLAESEDMIRMQHALMLFLMHSPVVTQLGLRIPSLGERSPWKVLPSKRIS